MVNVFSNPPNFLRKTELTQTIKNNYTKTHLDVLYKFYLADFLKQYEKAFPELRILKDRSIGKPSTDFMADLFATILNSSLLLPLFLKNLTPSLYKAVYKVVWFGEQSIAALGKEIGMMPFERQKDRYNWYGNYLLPEFSFFTFGQNPYGRSFSEPDLSINLPYQIQKQFRAYMEPPEGATLKGFEEVAKEENLALYEGEKSNNMPFALGEWGSFAMDHLELGGNDKPLKGSLKIMQAYCHIQEFYPKTKGANGLLATQTISNILLELKRLPKDSSTAFKAFLEDYTNQPTEFFINQFLRHFSRWQQHVFHADPCQVGDALMQATKALLPNKWVSIDDLSTFCRIERVPLFIWSQAYAVNELHLDGVSAHLRPDQNQRPWRGWAVASDLYDEAITKPLLRGHFAVMGLLGIVDLAYGEAINKKIWREKQVFLTPYDGIHYIRLSNLGAYLLGLTDTYVPATQVENRPSVQIHLDEQYLIATLSGLDALKAATLERFGVAQTKSRYKVSFSSFLKGVMSLDELENRITLFEQLIAPRDEWPPNWIVFFEQVKRRIRPIQLKSRVSVFQLNNDPELHRLFLTDPELMKWVKKAEGHMIIVEEANVSALKSRLGLLGYVMP